MPKGVFAGRPWLAKGLIDEMIKTVGAIQLYLPHAPGRPAPGKMPLLDVCDTTSLGTLISIQIK